MNVFGEEWDETPYPTPSGWEQRTKALVPRGHALGIRLYELPPGQTQVLYDFHHGNEEAVVVLRGQPTVRTPAGERELEPGEVVFFPSGPDGAHQLFNAGDERQGARALQARPALVDAPPRRRSRLLRRRGTAAVSENTCTRREFDASASSPYPAKAMLLTNAMDRNRGGATVRLAGPRGAL